MEFLGSCSGVKMVNALVYLVRAVLILVVGAAVPSLADDKTVRLYLDADWSNAQQSALSIEQGVRVALSEVGYTLGGFRVEIVVKDHHGNSRRSKRNLEQFLMDPKALAVIAGMHSPPLLATREFINQNQIPVLVPWAAAAPITRYPSSENFIFRLSIDDSKAGYVIARHAVLKNGVKKPYLLLENTGWGKSNYTTLSRALEEMNISAAPVIWFDWGLSEVGAADLVRTILKSDVDGVFLVANVPEGRVIAKALATLAPDQSLPLFSHWGITGADFPQTVDPAARAAIDLQFIQTSFSFINQPQHELAIKVFNNLRRLYPHTIRGAKDIKAPTGFIHAYDLTRLLIAAVQQTGLTGDIRTDRVNIKRALENLETPVEGLVKTYQKPFSIFDRLHPDAHEALGIDDFVMAHYGNDNAIILEP